MYVFTFVIEKFKYSKKLQIFLNTLHILKYFYVLFVIVIVYIFSEHFSFNFFGFINILKRFLNIFIFSQDFLNQ